MEPMYFLYTGGEQRGPYVEAQIKTMWSAGGITADTYYWNESATEWEPVLQLLKPKITPATRKTPPPLPPPLPFVAAARAKAKTPRAQPPPLPAPAKGSSSLTPVLWLGLAVLLFVVAALSIPRQDQQADATPWHLAPEADWPEIVPPAPVMPVAPFIPVVPIAPEPRDGEVHYSARDIAKRCYPSVVTIYTKNRQGQGMMGSGFFIAPNIIATNFHVIDGSYAQSVKFFTHLREYPVLRVIRVDKRADLALLQVNLPNVPFLPLAEDGWPDIGMDVFAIGSPQGLEGTLSTGIVSSWRTELGPERIQFTAPISPGNSGGPLINAKGQVIGVVVATMLNMQNVNLAVPVRDLRSLAR